MKQLVVFYYNIVIMKVMIKSIQKVIKVGSSGGVTIPAKEMKRQNINYGDEVQITVEPLARPAMKTDLPKEYAAFAARYGQTLKNLSNR